MVWHGRCAAHSLYGQRKPKCIIYGPGGLGSRAFQLCVFWTQNDRGMRAVCGLKWPCEKGLNCESSKNLRGPGVELRASAGVIARASTSDDPRGVERRAPRRGRRRAATPEARRRRPRGRLLSCGRRRAANPRGAQGAQAPSPLQASARASSTPGPRRSIKEQFRPFSHGHFRPPTALKGLSFWVQKMQS